MERVGADAVMQGARTAGFGVRAAAQREGVEWPRAGVVEALAAGARP